MITGVDVATDTSIESKQEDCTLMRLDESGNLNISLQSEDVYPPSSPANPYNPSGFVVKGTNTNTKPPQSDYEENERDKHRSIQRRNTYIRRWRI